MAHFLYRKKDSTLIVTRAPLRIPLGGGGTDLPSFYKEHGGFVISAAIDKYVYIQLNKLKIEDFIRVKYANTELVSNPKEIKHPLLREALIHSGITTGVEISAMSDVPGRTGMGSSGSFTVALITTLNTLNGENFSRKDLAEEAFYVEAERAKQPTGKQDPFIGAFGGLTCFEIDQSGEVTVSPLKLKENIKIELANNLLVFFTGIKRESFDILSEQVSATQSKNTTTVDSLHETKNIGYQVREALTSGQLDQFGFLLDQHWQNKKKRSSSMTNTDIDRWYEVGCSAGALGGKILGAGGGGFLMFYCPLQYQKELRRKMAKEGLREMRFAFDYEGATVLLDI